MKFFFSNSFSEFISVSSMFFNRAQKCKTWPCYSENLCKKCFIRSKISPKHWFHEKIFSSTFHVFEDFNFKTWHFQKYLIRKWIVVEVSFKIWFYLGSFDWNFVPSPINFLWENYFFFKVWNVNFSIRKLTGNKMVLSNSDTQ